MPVKASFGFAIAALVVGASCPAASHAEAEWMSESALRATFAGGVIDGHYASGKSFVESYGTDGRVEYNERGVPVPGRWSVTAGSFCTIYDRDPTGGCYRVRQVGVNCYEFYFIARTESEARKPDAGKPSWTARGWIKGKPATCADGANA